MAKTKKVTKKDIIATYMKQVLEKGKTPKSVYAFYQETGILEEDFYMHFGSFKAVQKEIYVEFFHHTIDLLSKNDEYETYDARTKLLSFHYTFFELLKANRSYVLLSLKSFKDFPQLSLLRKNFKGYINSLDMNAMELPHEKLERFKEKGIAEMAWTHLMYILKFWMEDSSANFEKTDVLIEKSVNTGFDLVNAKPFHGLLDLGKFLFQEKANFSFG